MNMGYQWDYHKNKLVLQPSILLWPWYFRSPVLGLRHIILPASREWANNKTESDSMENKEPYIVLQVCERRGLVNI